MNRSRSSNAWLREHVTDTYVQRARAEGYRSRAAYKLLEMDDKDHLIRAGDVVVDLGASPGGWAQVAAGRMQGKGRIIAVDLLEMAPLRGVTFLQGDFREAVILQELERLLAGDKVGLVLSDMSPNISGVSVSDQARGAHLAELALEFARNWLKPDGAFCWSNCSRVVAFTDFLLEMRKTFRAVSSRKPGASRDRSPEVYLLGRNRKT
jgi:23S rRNA (uridine2552-2'-O)-methyltransferase